MKYCNNLMVCCVIVKKVWLFGFIVYFLIVCLLKIFFKKGIFSCIMLYNYNLELIVVLVLNSLSRKVIVVFLCIVLIVYFYKIVMDV